MGVRQGARRWGRVGGWGVGLTIAFGVPLGVNVAIAQNNPVPPGPFVTSPTVKRPILRRGSQGASVAELQGILRLLGYYQGPVTGTYDEATAIAVSQFQTAAGLRADGIAGAETWTGLFPEPTAVTGAVPTVTVPSSPAVAPRSSPAGTTAATFPVPGVSRGTGAARTSPPASTSPRRSNVATPNQGNANRPPNLPILRQGMQGTEVTRLQQRLRTWGFFTGPINGNFGPMTQAAVIAAQQRFRLTADGVVGAETWRALMRSPL